MIALGFRGGRASGGMDSDVGMLDVSANALAVLILATMLVISSAAPPVPRGEVPDERDVPDLFFPPAIDATPAPQNTYFLVLQSGLVGLDMDAFALQFAENSSTASTEQGTMSLLTDRRIYRDLNDYRARFEPDYSALANMAEPLAKDSVADAAQAWADAFDGDKIAVTFLVEANAVDVFAPLYWEMRKRQVPIRWFTLTEGSPLVFTRSSRNFERRTRQWQ